LRLPGGFPKYRLTEAETLRDRPEAVGKSEDKAGVDTRGNRRIASFLFDECSLKLMRLKGYVGGLDVSAFDCLHIGLVASAMI